MTDNTGGPENLGDPEQGPPLDNRVLAVLGVVQHAGELIIEALSRDADLIGQYLDGEVMFVLHAGRLQVCDWRVADVTVPDTPEGLQP